jgi:hypothetical protein
LVILGRFEKLKKDAAFAPRQRPSSWRVSSYIKASRDLKKFFLVLNSGRAVIHPDLTFLKGLLITS